MHTAVTTTLNPPLLATQRPSRRPWLVIAAVVFAVYLPAVFQEFVEWDDTLVILNNPRLNPPSLDGVRYYWSHPFFNLYMPVTCTAWAALAKVAQVQTPDAMGFRLNPYVFHLAQVILHLIAALAVYEILRIVVRQRWIAAAGSLLFALHPLQIESVAFVGALNVPLAAAFGLSAVALYLSDPELRWRSPRYLIATLLMLLAMLSKPNVVVLPVVAVLLDAASRRRPLRPTVISILPWLVLIVPCVIWTKLIQPGATGATVDVPIASRLFVAGDAMAFYVWKLLAPYPLAIDYGRTPAFVMQHAWGRVTWLVPAALLLMAWLTRRRWPVLAAGVVIFVVAILPSSGLVRFDYQRVSNTADRYSYLAMLGAAIVFAWSIEKLSKRGAAVAIGVLVACIALTESQIRTWRNGEALFTHAIEVNPRSWMSRGDLGNILATRQPDRAIALFRRAIEINPQDMASRNGLAAMMVDRDPAQAIAQCNYILSQADMPEAWATLGCARRRQGDRAAALEAFARAYQLSPDNLIIAEDYAGELIDAGRFEEAKTVYRSIASRDPAAAQTGLDRVAQVEQHSK